MEHSALTEVILLFYLFFVYFILFQIRKGSKKKWDERFARCFGVSINFKVLMNNMFYEYETYHRIKKYHATIKFYLIFDFQFIFYTSFKITEYQPRLINETRLIKLKRNLKKRNTFADDKPVITKWREKNWGERIVRCSMSWWRSWSRFW